MYSTVKQSAQHRAITNKSISFVILFRAFAEATSATRASRNIPFFELRVKRRWWHCDHSWKVRKIDKNNEIHSTSKCSKHHDPPTRAHEGHKIQGFAGWRWTSPQLTFLLSFPSPLPLTVGGSWDEWTIECGLGSVSLILIACGGVCVVADGEGTIELGFILCGWRRCEKLQNFQKRQNWWMSWFFWCDGRMIGFFFKILL